MRLDHCGHWRPAMEQLFLAGLSGEEQNRLFDHVRGCSACHRVYLQHLAVERAAVHGDAERADEPTHFEIERLGQRIFAQAVPVDAARRRGQWARRAAWVAVGVMVALAVPLLWHQLRPVEEGRELTPKGSAISPTVGLQALRLHHGPGGRALERTLPPLRSGDPERLRLGDSLVLLYTNRGPALHAFVLGIDEEGRPLWYFPAPPQSHSVRLKAEVVDQPFGRPVRLRVNHRAGRLTVLGLFSPRQLTAVEVRRALERARSEGRALLPLGPEVQQLRLELLVQAE